MSEICQKKKKTSYLIKQLTWTDLYELEDGKGRSAVVFKQEADDAEELSVEAAVSEAEQETAEQRHADATNREQVIRNRKKTLMKEKIHSLNTVQTLTV